MIPTPTFCPIFLGHPKSEGYCLQSEWLLYGREPNGVMAEPGKQKPRSCRTQELARSSARENEWQKKGGVLDSGKIGVRSRVTSASTAEKTG